MCSKRSVKRKGQIYYALKLQLKFKKKTKF